VIADHLSAKPLHAPDHRQIKDHTMLGRQARKAGQIKYKDGSVDRERGLNFSSNCRFLLFASADVLVD